LLVSLLQEIDWIKNVRKVVSSFVCLLPYTGY